MNVPLPVEKRTVEIDELHLAAVRLDAASARRALVYAEPTAEAGTPEEVAQEHRMVEMDDAFHEAVTEFRRIIEERTGMDADAIERRLSL